nr:RNA-directed DNA polymerase, eukaryota [Tanacetum cinerariifolium]
GLVEVPSHGYSFTWSHKSSSKMSRLDRFLVSDDLQRTCHNLSSLTLDRYLSDHRPIILRELNIDYGPMSFCFFHNWFELEGFESFVADTWRNIITTESYDMLKMAKKLKILKGHIHRMAIMNNLTSLDNMESIELAQKAKVKWSIEGDENSKFFHGIINKRRNNLAIRGIIVDGEWIEDLIAVKNEFLSYFKTRFETHYANRLILDMDFPNRLSPDQAQDTERVFAKEEIKEAIWDCGLDKSLVLTVLLLVSISDLGVPIFQRPQTGRSSIAVPVYSFHEKSLPVVLKGCQCLRTNLYKSKLMGIAVENSLVNLAANSIGCMTLNHPFQYLGVNIGGHMSRISSWDVVINKILGRLSKWKSKVLYVGGRLTLLKSVVGSTPIYYMSMFKAPIHVILKAICSHFFNGVDPNVHKMTFVKWENVLTSKENGGLGVSSFYALNCALIFKWVWRFHTQSFSLWSRVIKALNGEYGKLSYPIKSCFSSNWIDIVRTLPTLFNKGINLLGFIKKKVGNWENTMFWRNPRSGTKQSKMAMLLSHLEEIRLPNMLDRWSWLLSGDGEFSVSSTGNLIDDKTLGTVGSKMQ